MELLLGTAQLLGNYGRFRSAQSPHNPCNILRTAISEGFNGLDTAPTYDGVERAIGVCGWQNTIHTKIEPNLDPLVSLNRTLGDLGSKSVEVLYFHDPEVLSRGPSFFRDARNRIPSEVVTSLGVSVYSPTEFKEALEIPEITSVQIPLNIADGRFSDDLLLLASERNLEVYARSIFLQGALFQAPRDLPDHLAPLRRFNQSLRRLATEGELSIAELAIAWVKDRPGISGLVMGAETPQQARELGRASRSRSLRADELRFIRSIQLVEPHILDPRKWTLS